jgi:hypothetical protein
VSEGEVIGVLIKGGSLTGYGEVGFSTCVVDVRSLRLCVKGIAVSRVGDSVHFIDLG